MRPKQQKERNQSRRKMAELLSKLRKHEDILRSNTVASLLSAQKTARCKPPMAMTTADTQNRCQAQQGRPSCKQHDRYKNYYGTYRNTRLQATKTHKIYHLHLTRAEKSTLLIA